MNPTPPPSINRTMPTKYVANTNIIFNSDGPGEVVIEINGKDNNLNKDFEAECAWLVSHYTSAPSAACTAFDVWIQTRVNDKHPDLSQGIGRERRYIVPVVSPAGREKVTDVALFRSQSPISRPPEGYSGASCNINRGRGGDYLYIVWKALPFEPTQILDGVYIIRNKALNEALDLFEGKADNCTRVNGCSAVPMEKHYFNHNWWIERIRGRSQYSVRNVRTNTYLEVAQGSSENGTRVQAHSRNEGAAQEWDIIGNDEAGYSFFNVGSGTLLDLWCAPCKHERPVIAHSSHGGDNQIWFLERRSLDTAAISMALNDFQCTSDQFKHSKDERVYMICPEETILEIWNEYKLNSRQQRTEYGVDDLASSMKAAVADWAYSNIRAPVRLLFGVIFCTNGETQHTYNWSLDQSLSSVVFFKPQSGRMTIIPKYANYFGVY